MPLDHCVPGLRLPLSGEGHWVAAVVLGVDGSCVCGVTCAWWCWALGHVQEGSDTLLQLPHLTSTEVGHIVKGKGSCRSIADYLKVRQNQPPLITRSLT
jgi:hypothetical protein